jgi:hypothetical protein
LAQENATRKKGNLIKRTVPAATPDRAAGGGIVSLSTFQVSFGKH